MKEQVTEITCKKCGGKDNVILCIDPQDDIDKIACFMSEHLISESICDNCRNDEKMKWLERTQTFVGGKELFKIPNEHKEYKKDLASKAGRILGIQIHKNYNNHLYISGDYDLGKSKACCAMLVYLQSKKSKKTHYVAFNELINAYSSLAKDANKSKADDYLKKLLDCDFLVIDDFCKKKLTNSNCEAVYQLAEYIYTHDHNCKVWITANYGYQKILNDKWEDYDMGKATFSRFERCGFLVWNSTKNEFK